jgi:hypothetical protein
MSGTSSQTAAAWSRGQVGRKLKANLRPEEHKLHTRHRSGGRGDVGIRSPMTSRPWDVYAAGVEGRSRALPWEICLFAMFNQPQNAVRAHRTRRPRPSPDAHSGEGTNKLCSGEDDVARTAERQADEQTEVSSGHSKQVQLLKGQTQGRRPTQNIRCSWRSSQLAGVPSHSEKQVAEPPIALRCASSEYGM